MPDFDDLLEETEESQAFDADSEPVFDADYKEDSAVVALEPPIISIGRAKRREYLRKMQEESK